MTVWNLHRPAMTALTVAVLALGSPAALAQSRPALVRDIDAPALAPFNAGTRLLISAISQQQLLTTVPAGKRLVVEQVSYSYQSASGNQLVFAALRRGEFGPVATYLQINPPHASASSSFILQDGAQLTKVYFEAGEQVWVTSSNSGGTVRELEVRLNGYLVTPP